MKARCACGHSRLQHMGGRCLALLGYNCLCSCAGYKMDEEKSPLRDLIMSAVAQGDALAEKMAKAAGWL